MDTRQHDLQQLRQDYYRTSDPQAKRAIEEAGRRIQNEDGRTRSAREALLREVRKGKIDNAKDVKNDLYKVSIKK